MATKHKSIIDRFVIWQYRRTILSKKNLQEIASVILKLNCLPRWSDFHQIAGYDELAKQALNCQLAYMLAKYCEHMEIVIRWNLFPLIAIGRAFAKAYVYYDTPEHKVQAMAQLGNIGKAVFDETTKEIISEKTSEEFSKFICSEADENCFEVKLYKAATKVATYIELKAHDDPQTQKKEKEILESIRKYTSEIPGLEEFADEDSEIFKLCQQISSLRNKVRWMTHPKLVPCSVMGHLFDTAIWAYFIALEESDFDEEYATTCFFMGIFHDVAETWTHDVPSPIKNRVVGFRAATEAYERDMLNKHMYSKLEPIGLAEAVKEVMFEEEENKEYKVLLKTADYLSADSECWRQLVAGTRHSYYWEAIIERKINRDSRINRMMHDFFAKYAKKVRRKWR